jgi:hypothetical protein
MKINRFILFTITIIFPIISFAQESNIELWNSHIAYMDSHYQLLPQQKLDSITKDLDSTVISNQCYKFIPNSDNSKFLAFYLTDRNSETFDALKREYGGTFRNYTWGEKKEGQVEAFSYIVKGMLYKGNWYYDVDEYVEFYADSFDDAKSIFLIRSLLENKFFKKGEKPVENKRFWKKNEFKKSYLYGDEYPNFPELVAASISGKKTRNKYNSNKVTEKLACEISSDLWEYLQNSNSDLYSNRYKGKFMNDYCLCLYNLDRNTMLLPIIFYDKDRKPHISYYVAKTSSNSIILYKWKKFPDKEIHRASGKESLEVIYDIRKFILNWSWGTNNLISTFSFWNDNFTDSDLELSKYQNNSR